MCDLFELRTSLCLMEKCGNRGCLKWMLGLKWLLDVNEARSSYKQTFQSTEYGYERETALQNERNSAGKPARGIPTICTCLTLLQFSFQDRHEYALCAHCPWISNGHEFPAGGGNSVGRMSFVWQKGLSLFYPDPQQLPKYVLLSLPEWISQQREVMTGLLLDV